MKQFYSTVETLVTLGMLVVIAYFAYALLTSGHISIGQLIALLPF